MSDRDRLGDEDQHRAPLSPREALPVVAQLSAAHSGYDSLVLRTPRQLARALTAIRAIVDHVDFSDSRLQETQEPREPFQAHVGAVGTTLTFCYDNPGQAFAGPALSWELSAIHTLVAGPSRTVAEVAAVAVAEAGRATREQIFTLRRAHAASPARLALAAHFHLRVAAEAIESWTALGATEKLSQVLPVAVFPGPLRHAASHEVAKLAVTAGMPSTEERELLQTLKDLRRRSAARDLDVADDTAALFAHITRSTPARAAEDAAKLRGSFVRPTATPASAPAGPAVAAVGARSRPTLTYGR